MRVRDDDVLLLSSSYPSHALVVERFKKVHRLITDAGGLHVTAVLGKEISSFPGIIDFMSKEVSKGLLIPEIHGWEHVDYAKYTKDQIIEDLKKSIDLIETNFQYTPTIFYTPWGANAPHIEEASNTVNLKMVDCSNIVQYRKWKPVFGGNNWQKYCQALRESELELFIHWWQGGLNRMVAVLQTAKNNDPTFIRNV